MLTDEQIDEARETARKTYRHSQAQIRGQQFTVSDDPEWHFACAIEAAATEPLLQRIAELERQLEEARKDAERYRWLREYYSPECSGRYMTDIDRGWYGDGIDLDAAIDADMQKDQS